MTVTEPRVIPPIKQYRLFNLYAILLISISTDFSNRVACRDINCYVEAEYLGGVRISYRQIANAEDEIRIHRTTRDQ